MQYAVKIERREGLTRDLPPGNEDQRWVANAATLVWGDGGEAVLVDTFVTIDQNDRLIDWIREQDVRLAAVYITHGHGDHSFGVGQLRAAFPDARFLATAGTVAQTRAQNAPAYRAGFWERLFPGQIPPAALPDVLEESSFEVGGHRAQVIETGFTDGVDSTVLWVPDSGVLAAGDVVYNHTYPYLAESTTQSRRSWIAALEGLRAVGARYVVSAHKDPALGDSPTDIDATIRYLEDVARIEQTSVDAPDFYRQMLALHPDRINVGSLWGAARSIKPDAPQPSTR